MWTIPGVRRILAYRDPVDLRKSFTGLVGLVKRVFGEDPLSGNVFVFINRRGTLIKTLYWDRTGICLFAKRLERGRFRLPGEGPGQELDVQRLQLGLDGIELGRRHKV
jgi:transposase